jgi:hypothetical protein
MKTKLFILSFFVLVFSTVNAHVITVSNNAVNAGHFNNLQIAADSANVGDTIYVMGSPTDYGNVTLNTRVTLIGAGYAVTGTQYNYSSVVDNIYLDSLSFGSPVSGTKVMGFYINSNFDYSGTANINNVDIERCYVSGNVYVNGHGWIIRNNDVSIQMQNYGYAYIQNNFLYYVQNSNQTTVVIDHNDFVTNNGYAFYQTFNALITNNVFYYCNPEYPTPSYETNNTFSNNIVTNSSAINLNAYAGNTGSGNIFATPPGFSDAAIPANTVCQTCVWSYTWGFKVGSPAHNTATDGTDIGVYGGSYVLPNITGATRIPQMTLMNVSGIVPAGGSINVNFKARDQK